MKLRSVVPALLLLTLGSVSYAIDGNLVIYPTEGPQVSFPMDPPPVIVVQNNAEQIRITSDSVSQTFNLAEIRKITVEQLTGMFRPSETQLPETFTLGEAYPNPFNPSTTIDLSLPRAGKVTVQVFDLAGRSVRRETLDLSAGIHPYLFESKAGASPLASGLYLLQAEFENTMLARRLVLVK